jgi:hypothetical protein
MPKKPPRHNPPYRAFRTVQSAATVLRRISRKTGVVAPAQGGVEGSSHIASIRAGLPEELRPHLLDCLLKPAEIVLFAESASWATRLRVAAIEAADAGAFAGLTGANPRVTVRVSPRPQRR